MPIILNSSENIQIAGIETISADLTFNPTLLYTTGYDIERIDAQTAKIRNEDIPADAQAGEVLKSVKFIVGLGNAEECDLILSDAETVGGEADIDLINGKFNLPGVCYEGGVRLSCFQTFKRKHLTPKLRFGNPIAKSEFRNENMFCCSEVCYMNESELV